ncbi:PREDICTED: bromodomain-containing protein DDB_G0280777 [Papilio xuthus]|uniref:Bromodomain-containing protein DDB_G0280777 n=1 Tax=Papilio xuthus TaxID=66420 RepID=A0AAJ6Z5W6_PAPXU
MKIVLLFAVILCAYAAEEVEKKNEMTDLEQMESQDKRQTQEGSQDQYRSGRKQEQVAPVQENPEEDKSSGSGQTEEYRPGQVFSLNAQELLELQPERKAPLANNQQLQQLQQLYNPQQEHQQNLQQSLQQSLQQNLQQGLQQNIQPFYYLDPQLAGQVSLQPSHTVIARPHYTSNGGEASVGAALSVSDSGSATAHPFDQELLALFSQARQEDDRQQIYTQQILPQALGQQYQQVERYVTKPSKKPTKLRPKIQVVPTQASTAPQQYLIETTNVQSQAPALQYRPIQSQRTGQTLRYIPLQVAQQAISQPLYERPESQGLKIVPAPNLQNLQPQTQGNYVFVPQYQQPEPAQQKQYKFVDTQRQTIQNVRQEQPRIAVERPLAYLKRFPEPEKTRTVKIYNQSGLEGLSAVPQAGQNEQYYIRPLYRQNEQRPRYDLSALALRSFEQARAAESTKSPLSTIYVHKNTAPKKVSRPSVRIESQREQSASSEYPIEQGRALEYQRPQLPPPKNNKAYTPEEFQALVAAGYSVTPIPVGTVGEQPAQSRSSVEAIQIPQRRVYTKRNQYLPLRSDEAP